MTPEEIKAEHDRIDTILFLEFGKMGKILDMNSPLIPDLRLAYLIGTQDGQKELYIKLHGEEAWKRFKSKK